MIWDAQEGCEHAWGEEKTIRKFGRHGDNAQCGNTKKDAMAAELNQGQFCQLCGAWRGCLGLEPNPELYIKHMVEIFSELRRVLRNDGTFWLNMGDSYAGGGRGGKNGCGKGSLEEGRYDKGQKIGLPTGKIEGMKPKDLCGIPWMLAFALRADGWWLRSDIIWEKPNPMPESVTDRPTKAHEYLFLLTKSSKYFYDNEAIKEAHSPDGRKVTTTTIGPGAHKNHLGSAGHERWPNSGRNKRTVWTIPTQPMPEAHFATFPEKLIEPCILAGTSEKGCCVECEAPWKRITEKGEIISRGGSTKGVRAKIGNESGLLRNDNKDEKVCRESKTIGWKPSCGCYGTEPLPTIPKQGKDEDDIFYQTRIAPILQERKNLLDLWQPLKAIPCTALDIFGGSMTTAIVSHKHGRKFIMIELSKEYIDEIGIPRIEKATKQKGWNRFK